MNGKLRGFIRITAFVLIFLTLLTAMTLFFLPKWPTSRESAQMSGFYREPENTIDVLCLSSCNMYTSVSPVVLYEEYGITAYDFCCPDQEMSTTYYYLRDALKTQKPKAVIIEALFMTCQNTKKREYYNRYALDYMPMSLNKLRLAAHMAPNESALMQKYDPTAPDALLTFAGYVFPILRYHSRTDLNSTDATFFLENDFRNSLKGGWTEYNYTTNDGNFYNKLFNDPGLTDETLEYFPKIKELCDEEGIELLVMISPNYARWGYDDEQTRYVTEYAAQLGVPVLNFHSEENNCFEEYEYGFSTGRLNVFGQKHLSAILGEYLTDICALSPTELSDDDRAKWDNCVEEYYRLAEENGCNVSDGQIAQLSSLEDAVRVRWNPCGDCVTNSIYRCIGKDGDFELLTDSAEGNIFDDTDVSPGQGYTYRVVPNEGRLAGISSDDVYGVFVEKPGGFTAINDDGSVVLDWDEVSVSDYYLIRRTLDGEFNYSRWDTAAAPSYKNSSSISEGTEYYYRLCAVIEEAGVEYCSESVNTSCVPISTPQITSCESSDGKNVISWEILPHSDSITVLRRAESEDEFEEYDVLPGNVTSFTDSDTEPDVQYFYKLVSSLTTKNRGSFAVSADSNTVGVRTK